MGLRAWLNRACDVGAGDARFGPDGENYSAIQRAAGEATAWYDQRTIPNAAPPQQPQQAYSPAEMRMIDPGWQPR